MQMMWKWAVEKREENGECHLHCKLANSIRPTPHSAHFPPTPSVLLHLFNVCLALSIFSRANTRRKRRKISRRKNRSSLITPKNWLRQKGKSGQEILCFFRKFLSVCYFLLPTSGAARCHFSVALISCYLLNRILLFKLYTYFVGLFKLRFLGTRDSLYEIFIFSSILFKYKDFGNRPLPCSHVMKRHRWHWSGFGSWQILHAEISFILRLLNSNSSCDVT